jgi:hypothetical protein
VGDDVPVLGVPRPASGSALPALPRFLPALGPSSRWAWHGASGRAVFSTARDEMVQLATVCAPEGMRRRAHKLLSTQMSTRQTSM